MIISCARDTRKVLKIANSVNGDPVIVCLHLPLKAYVFVIDRNRFFAEENITQIKC